MRVLHISKFDRKGGAAIAAFNSVRSQRALGLDARLAVGRKLSDADFVIEPKGLSKARAAFAFAAERLPFRALGVPRFDVRSVGRFGIDVASLVRVQDPDLIVLHNIDGVASLEAMARINRPIVWRMHDMWATLGIRHYDDGTDPLSGVSAVLDRWTLRRKAAAVSAVANLTLCPPSRWLGEVGKASPITGGRPCVVIPNGIEIDAFTPAGAREARAALGIPVDSLVIAFGASSGADEPRKGGDLLRAAIESGAEALRNAGIHLLVYGGGGEAFAGLDLPITTLGHLPPGTGMAGVYRAADIAVVPSRMENLSLTVLEAMACGTPVVAFRIGGMPDMIRDGDNGWLAEPVSAPALLKAIERAVKQLRNDPNLPQRARQEIESRFSLESEARAMCSMFERILASKPRGCS